MPFQKILAPFLPKNQRNNKGKKDSPVVRELAALSPKLPLSPAKHTTQTVNGNGDPIIDLDTVDEDVSSAKSDETIMEEPEEENTATAVVLHEKPTAFELCDNDLIIESVKDIQDEEVQNDDEKDYDKDMMRDSSAMTVYKSNNAAATTSANAIGFTPPQEEQEEGATITELPDEKEFQAAAMVALPPSPPSATEEQQQQQQQQQETEFDFIKPLQAETLHAIFVSPKMEEVNKEHLRAHFPMETTFKRHDSNAGFSSTYKKLIRGAKSLIWKPDSPRNMKRAMSTLSTKFDNNGAAPAGRSDFASRNMDTSFGTTLNNKQDVVEDITPIYRLRNTSGKLLVDSIEDPVEAYNSPAIGTAAYDIQKLCDQSFFGRW